MKKLIIISIIIIFLCLLPGIIYEYDKYSDKKEKEKYEKEKQEKEDYLTKLKNENTDFEWILGLEGNFEITYDGVSVSDLQYDKDKINIFVYYYNYYNDSDISCKLIMREYNNFCKGSEDYKHLKDFTDFITEMYYFDNEEISPDKIHSDVFLRECTSGLYKTYGKKKILSEEEVEAVCDIVMEHKYEMYLIDIVSRVESGFMPYMFDNKTYEEINTYGWLDVIQETNEEIICDTLGDIVYYEPDKNWYTNEECYRLKKFIILKEHYDIGNVIIGTKRDDVKPRFEGEIKDFKLVEENKYKMVYARDEIYITFEFNEDGECNRMTMEIKD